MALDVIVCVKQVPGTNQVEVDADTGVLKRDGVDSKLNPYDLFAIEAALEMVDKEGGSVKTLTMGPMQAKEALLETVYMGAQEGVLLTDRALAGADVLATAYALSQAIMSMGDFDLLICGKQTTDGDTAQVGAEIAEFLDIPHANNVLAVEQVYDDSVTVRVNFDNSIVTQIMDLPCLICMESDINTPHLPSYRRMKQLDGDLVSGIGLSELPDPHEEHYGLMGSPTQVEKIFPPDKKVDRETHTGTGEELAAKLAEILVERKFL